MKKLIAICAVVTILMGVSAAQASQWNTFVIRGANSDGALPVITEDPTGYSGWTSFGIVAGGQKAGWGTDIMNGMTVSSINSLSITRHASVSGYGPYFNIWVTDGSGGFAVIANEPSNTGEWTGESAYEMTWDGTLKNATAKVYEATTGFLKPSGSTYTFSDFAGYQIAAPTNQYGTTGSGAPDVLNATPYTAYGFNWVFGDTLNNYVEGTDLSYLVRDPTLVSNPIPEPTTMLLFSLGLLGITGINRKKE